MAVSKQELVGSLNAQQTEEVRRLEVYIDTKLSQSFTPDSLVTIPINKLLHARVRLELQCLYRKQGWKMHFVEDRGFHSIELS